MKSTRFHINDPKRTARLVAGLTKRLISKNKKKWRKTSIAEARQVVRRSALRGATLEAIARFQEMNGKLSPKKRQQIKSLIDEVNRMVENREYADDLIDEKGYHQMMVQQAKEIFGSEKRYSGFVEMWKRAKSELFSREKKNEARRR